MNSELYFDIIICISGLLHILATYFSYQYIPTPFVYPLVQFMDRQVFLFTLYSFLCGFIYGAIICIDLLCVFMFKLYKKIDNPNRYEV